MMLGSSSLAQITPSAGQLLITEFMANPAAVSDTKGEWFEIMNTSNAIIELNGLIIADQGSNEHSIKLDDSFPISPGEIVVFARNNDYTENGGIHPDYTYQNFSLGNAEDEIIIKNTDGIVIDQLNYLKDWVIEPGYSNELNLDIMDHIENDKHSNWHQAIEVYGAGDFGTPGLSNSQVSSVITHKHIRSLDIYPNPSVNLFTIRLELLSPKALKINLISILGQRLQLAEFNSIQHLVLPVETQHIHQGLYWIELIAGEETTFKKVLITGNQL